MQRVKFEESQTEKCQKYFELNKASGLTWAAIQSFPQHQPQRSNTGRTHRDTGTENVTLEYRQGILTH